MWPESTALFSKKLVGQNLNIAYTARGLVSKINAWFLIARKSSNEIDGKMLVFVDRNENLLFSGEFGSEEA
jgi:hypothetical protein